MNPQARASSQMTVEVGAIPVNEDSKISRFQDVKISICKDFRGGGFSPSVRVPGLTTLHPHACKNQDSKSRSKPFFFKQYEASNLGFQDFQDFKISRFSRFQDCLCRSEPEAAIPTEITILASIVRVRVSDLGLGLVT